MTKVFHLMTACTISVVLATSSIAPAQTYKTIDFPGAIATTINGGPDSQGTSVGTYTDTSKVNHGFSLTREGVFTPFDPPGSTATTPNFIVLGHGGEFDGEAVQRIIVGGYLDAAGTSHGFILEDGKFTTLDFPGAAGTSLTGRNPQGAMTGFSCKVASCASGVTHSFKVSTNGEFTSFDPPGAVASTASTINPVGAIVGAYTDAKGFTHGYLLYHRKFVPIDFPDSEFTFAGGNNPEGDIVGAYSHSKNAAVLHSFLLRNGAFTSFDPPGAVFSDASGINAGGIIVGLFVDKAGVVHGFVRTP